jgi:hypothetical protein
MSDSNTSATYEIEFISEFDFDMKYGIHPLSRFLGGLPRMTYDQMKYKILIRNLVGLSEYQVYCLLCHEVLHAVLHKLIGLGACLKMDNLGDVDGQNAYVWLGESFDPAQT